MSGPSRQSLSRRLLVGLVLVSFGYWTVVALLTVRDSADKVYELFDAHLAQTALALLRVTDPDENDPVRIPADEAPSPALSDLFSQWATLPDRIARARPAGAASGARVVGSIHSMHAAYEKKLRYQVWSRSGQLLLRSANAPETTMAVSDGFSETEDAQGRLWRHFGVWDRHHDFRILVSEAHELRYQLVRSIALHTASPLALGLPVLILLLWLSIHRGLDPLGVLTRQIETRKPDNLTPLDAGSAPRELRSVVQALNALLRRVAHALDGERRFTANAAHELRTPLAAIQAQLHVARGAQGESERQRAMDQLQRGVERGIRVVGQMLTLARLDPEQALPACQPLAPHALAEAVSAELAPLALQRGQTLELHADSELPTVSGSADLLSMLLANLLDNAIRYTPRGGRIDVAVRGRAGGVQFEVADDGPGIPPAQRERVFERFYRIARPDQEGTGLGLAICRRVADLHGARITLADGPGGRGLVVRVRLPAGPP